MGRLLPAGSGLIGVGFITLAVAFSLRVMFALAMPFIAAETAWSLVLLSAAMSVTLIVSGLLTPVAGRLLDRYGPRAVLIGGLGLIALGMGITAAAAQPALLIFGFGIIAGGGFALVSTSVVSTAVALAFDRNRGFATGVATSGESAGQFLLIPLFALLLGAASWRLAFAAGAVAAVLLAGVIAFAMRGDRGRTAPASRRPATLRADLRYLSGQPVFYLLFLSYFICGLTTTGFVESQFMPYVSFCGFPPVPTATAYGLLSLVNLFGMVGAGWLTDRVNRVALLASIYIVRALSFLLLLGVAPDYQTLIVFAVVFGAADYSTVPVTVSLCASHLGTRVLGLSFGLISSGHALGAALGAIVGGVLFASTAGYSVMWLVAVLTALGAALLSLAIFRTGPAGAAA